MNENTNEPILIGVEDVCALLGVKQSCAYNVIRQLNAKMKKNGKITISGKIHKQYLLENFEVKSNERS